MREHAYLAAMVGFVRKHIAQHFDADRPGPAPAISAKLFDATAAAERFRKHLSAASGAFGQCRAGLPRSTVRAVELARNLEVRSCQPDPLGTDVVHVGKNRRDGADFAGGFGVPYGRIKMFDQNLVHALVGSEGTDCGSAEWRGNLSVAGGHGYVLLDVVMGAQSLYKLNM